MYTNIKSVFLRPFWRCLNEIPAWVNSDNNKAKTCLQIRYKNKNCQFCYCPSFAYNVVLGNSLQTAGEYRIWISINMRSNNDLWDYISKHFTRVVVSKYIIFFPAMQLWKIQQFGCSRAENVKTLKIYWDNALLVPS